jgi:hypothetical protein
MFSFENRRLLLELGRPLWKPRDRYRYFVVFDPKQVKFFSVVNFFSIFGRPNRGSGLDPDPERYSA